MKKKILIIVLIPLILFSMIGLYKYIRIKTAKIDIKLKDNLTLEFNDQKKVSDYIDSINGKILDNYEIKSNKIGTKEIKFSFINDDNIKLDYSFNIDVVDTVKPIIWVGDSYSVVKGSDIDLTKSILCGDNYDSKPTCTIEGTYDLSKVGKYPLTYKAIDQSGNTTIQKFNLYVYEPDNDTPISEPVYIPFSEIVKKYKNKNTEIGIDVSTWQGDIDFRKLSDAGVEFIIIRVGYSGDKKDSHILDSKFKRNIKEANKYGIKAGIYFYSYARNILEAKNEAKWVVNQIKSYRVDLPVAFDWEEWGNFNDYNLSFFELSNMAKAYLDVISSKGYEGMLYSSKNYLEKIWFETNYDIWLAHYTDQTNYNGKYEFWQLSNLGLVDGINGPVDINIRYINK